MGVGGLRGLNDLLLLSAMAGVGDVLRYAGLEEHGLLQHDGKLVAQVRYSVVAQVDTV